MVWFAVVVAFPLWQARPDSERKRILVVGSYSEETPYQVGFLQGFEERLSGELPFLYREYLDYPKFQGAGHGDVFEAYLQSKYQERLDLIVAIGDIATRWLEQSSDFRSEAKRLLVVDDRELPYGYTEDGDFVLSVRDVEMDEALRLIDRLDSEGAIQVIFDDRSDVSQTLMDSVEASARGLGWEARLVPLTGGYETVEARLEGLPEGSSVLFLPFFQLEGGIPGVPLKALSGFVEGRRLRFYTMWDTLLGTGLLGGKMLMSRVVGERAAEQSVRLLAGAPMMAEGEFYEGQTAYVFDDEVRRRLGLEVSQLPADSVFVNRQQRFLEKYYWESILAVFVFAGLAVSTLVLRVLVAQKTEMLRRRNEDLNTALKQKNRLTDVGRGVSMLAHDLRNPVCLIRTCCDLLAESSGKNRDRGWVVKTMKESSEKSLSMIGDMLDYVRTLEPKIEAMPTSEFMRILEEDIRQLSSSGCDVRLECHQKGECNVNLDTIKVSRVVVNLVKNAIEALVERSVEKPAVLVSVTVEAVEVSIRVVDNGPGIAKDVARSLFEPFHSSGKIAGTGLGLAIAKEFVEAHGGTIRCNTKPGKTEFQVMLPNSEKVRPEVAEVF